MENLIPVKKNNYYQLQIDALGNEGQGIGRIDNFTIFVPLALPGDKVKIKILKVKKKYAYGKIIDIITPSPNRAKPICPIYGKCGGCQLQHLSYSEQLAFKKQKVMDALQRIGRLESEFTVSETIGMKQPQRYRNKAQFPVGIDKRTGGISIGFYQPKSHDIVDIENCYIQDPINDEIVKKIKTWMTNNNIKPYDEKSGNGFIRHIYTRIGVKSSEIMVVLVTNNENFPKKQEFVDTIRAIDSNIKSIIQNINIRKTNVILGNINKVLWGKESIVDYIGDIKFKISPMSFYQVNPVQTEVLYKKALQYAELNGSETIFDLYCGIGTISLFFAQKAKKVIGVEIVKEAIDDAKENAKINDINNLEFFTGAAEDIVPKLYKEGYKADMVIVDPPRKGCDENLLNTIINMEVDRIVYVSCNPSTLARDLKILEDAGYSVKTVQPVDMFPDTVHVECIALLQREIS